MEVEGYKIEPRADLSGAILVDVDLTGADLTGTKMPDGTTHD
jgi:uncharacterized protein YjbI with pentapeptide repeats